MENYFAVISSLAISWLQIFAFQHIVAIDRLCLTSYSTCHFVAYNILMDGMQLSGAILLKILCLQFKFDGKLFYCHLISNYQWATIFAYAMTDFTKICNSHSVSNWMGTKHNLLLNSNYGGKVFSETTPCWWCWKLSWCWNPMREYFWVLGDVSVTFFVFSDANNTSFCEVVFVRRNQWCRDIIWFL